MFQPDRHSDDDERTSVEDCLADVGAARVALLLLKKPLDEARGVPLQAGAGRGTVDLHETCNSPP